MPAKPALRTELLFYLSFLAAAALLVGVLTILVAGVFAPDRTYILVMLLVALEVGVFVVFGRHLINRLVLFPLERVVATADAVADGDLARRAPDAETRSEERRVGKEGRSRWSGPSLNTKGSGSETSDRRSTRLSAQQS